MDNEKATLSIFDSNFGASACNVSDNDARGRDRDTANVVSFRLPNDGRFERHGRILADGRHKSMVCILDTGREDWFLDGDEG
jgi:hypothetical protein